MIFKDALSAMAQKFIDYLYEGSNVVGVRLLKEDLPLELVTERDILWTFPYVPFFPGYLEQLLTVNDWTIEEFGTSQIPCACFNFNFAYTPDGSQDPGFNVAHWILFKNFPNDRQQPVAKGNFSPVVPFFQVGDVLTRKCYIGNFNQGIPSVVGPLQPPGQ